MVTALVLSLTLSAPFELGAWNQERITTQRVGFGVLGAWAVGNLTVGTIAALRSNDERDAWFHLGNALWNTVNLGLAIAGFAMQWNADPNAFDAKQSLRESSSSATIFGVNGGIDVGYVATGAFLWQRGLAEHDSKLVGMGQALILQGAFLFVFDVVMGVLNGLLTARILDASTITTP
ncbi:MAG: DUF6992 family protein [Archangium sp.]